ncbi:MAG: O-methyltransferase [Bacilli bacterium]|nr:O-methyltransferase [Bacilli bacterium]
MEIGFGSDMLSNDIIKKMKDYAKVNNVPIMTEGGMHYLLKYIKKNNIKNILEVGTAIGYSAIMMCGVAEDIKVTTIERDEKRYLEAIKNIKKTGLEDRIHLIYNDALNIKLTEKYDLIFIDAAKAQNRKFFERFENNLVENGTIITDNMKFHGLVDTEVEASISRNLRQLVRKIREYKVFLQENDKYETEFLDIGDGMAVSVKK